MNFLKLVHFLNFISWASTRHNSHRFPTSSNSVPLHFLHSFSPIYCGSTKYTWAETERGMVVRAQPQPFTERGPLTEGPLGAVNQAPTFSRDTTPLPLFVGSRFSLLFVASRKDSWRSSGLIFLGFCGEHGDQRNGVTWPGPGQGSDVLTVVDRAHGELKCASPLSKLLTHDFR